jgi:hypothetical protein
MTEGASLAQRDLVDADDGSRDDFVQPAPAASDGADQPEASFWPLWSDLFSRQDRRFFWLTLTVIALLDYSKGFGHADLVTS